MLQSLLDNDLYKFTMQQAVCALYPRAFARYEFIVRNKTPFPNGFGLLVQKAILKMADLELSNEEATYLKDVCYFLTPVYLDFLKHYRFDPSEVTVSQSGGELKLSVEGPWYKAILWEVPALAIISELYFNSTLPQITTSETARAQNIEKSKKLGQSGVLFADFGTRRRYSFENHQNVLCDIQKVKQNTLVGTSNLLLAKQFGIKPIGTLAHEWFMFHGIQNGYRLANKAAIDAWTQVYQGYLGIALTDTFTSEAFLATFDAAYARLFDGVRQDSGDPFGFADRVIEHYKKLRIDPLCKTIVFSDSLDVDKAIALKSYCDGKIRTSFGIGTHLTNDLGALPLNMVIKLKKAKTDADANWVNVVKLSDDKGKHTGDAQEIELCKKTIERSAQ